jgi:hypothetical protein
LIGLDRSGELFPELPGLLEHNLTHEFDGSSLRRDANEWRGLRPSF